MERVSRADPSSIRSSSTLEPSSSTDPISLRSTVDPSTVAPLRSRLLDPSSISWRAIRRDPSSTTCDRSDRCSVGWWVGVSIRDTGYRMP